MTEVKPLDVSYILRHAFLSGVVAARNIPYWEECDGPILWLDYDPGKNPSLERIWKAVYPNIPMAENPAQPLEISIDFTIVQGLAESANNSPWVPKEYSMNEIVSDCYSFLLNDRYDESRHKALVDAVSLYINLKNVYEMTPVDRGGKTGSKGQAFAEMEKAFQAMKVAIESQKGA